MQLFSAGAVYGSGYVMNMIDHWLGVDKVWNENIQKAMVSFRTIRVREIAEINKLIEKNLSKATSIAFLPEGEPNCCWMSVWGSSNSGFKLIIPPVKFLQSRQLPLLRIMTEANIQFSNDQEKVTKRNNQIEMNPSRSVLVTTLIKRQSRRLIPCPQWMKEKIGETEWPRPITVWTQTSYRSDASLLYNLALIGRR